MSVKIKDYRKNRGHGQKSIWLIFCLEVALYSKQTEMGLDFCSYCACASSYYVIGLMDRVDFTTVATAHVRDCEKFRNVAFPLLFNIVHGPVFLSIEQRDEASN